MDHQILTKFSSTLKMVYQLAEGKVADLEVVLGAGLELCDGDAEAGEGCGVLLPQPQLGEHLLQAQLAIPPRLHRPLQQATFMNRRILPPTSGG